MTGDEHYLEPSPARAKHPPSCRRCRGTGWQPGKPLHQTVNGELHRYSTVEPCTHHWPNDDPALNEPIPANHPRAMAAVAQGYIDGQHELFIISHGRCGAEDTTRRQDIA